MKVRRIIGGACAGALAISLFMVAPASAAPKPEAPTELLAAMQRDLGLTQAQAEGRIAAQESSAKLAERLTPKLGSDFAGSWLDDSGALVVAVSSAKRAAEVRAAGATAKVVPNTLAELTAIDAELATTDPAALTGLTAWRVDPQRNAVVATVQKGHSVAGLAKYGKAVVAEDSDMAPVTAANLYGGTRYNSCSVGFNAFKGATRYLLTAGHCGTIGTDAYSGGVWIGPFENSNFPGVDYGAIRVDNNGAWTQGPWIDAYNGGGVYVVNGHAFSPVGTSVCKSGYKTGLTCGVIKAKGESVAFDHDNNPATPTVWVHGLVRHTACVEPGDSGGANFSWNAANKIFAEGMTSGASMLKDAGGNLRCRAVFGQENISWFSLVTEAMVLYGLSLYTAP